MPQANVDLSAPDDLMQMNVCVRALTMSIITFPTSPLVNLAIVFTACNRVGQIKRTFDLGHPHLCAHVSN